MSDQIRDAITALQAGNSSEFKSAITSDLMDRAMGAIEVQKYQAGQQFFNPEAEVEVDPEEYLETEQESDIDSEPEELPDEEV